MLTLIRHKNYLRILLLITVLCLSFAGVASAHVTVAPKETTTGAYEKYTVRVPVEKDVHTTQVRLEFPAGLKVSTIQPVPDWDYELETDQDGRFTAIVWKAVGEGIGPHEFTEFAFVGKNPDETGTLAWKAYQTYADGSVVEWIGDPSSEHPASVTTVKQGTGNAHGHGVAADTGSSGGYTWSLIALILSVLALLLSLANLFRKKTS